MRPVHLRPALLEDMSRIERWHREQNERDGTAYPLARIFNADGTLARNIPAALIAEENGEPLGSLYVELVPELLFAGCHAKMTAFARRDIDAMLRVLAWQGYHGINCRVPRVRFDAVRKPLERSGFRSTEAALVNFFRDSEV